VIELQYPDLRHWSWHVHPIVYRNSELNAASANRRLIIVLDTSIGRIAMVMIGANLVDAIVLNKAVRKGAYMSRGEELGYFALGGSAILMLFDVRSECNLLFDERLIHRSWQGEQTQVFAAQELATFNCTKLDGG